MHDFTPIFTQTNTIRAHGVGNPGKNCTFSPLHHDVSYIKQQLADFHTLKPFSNIHFRISCEIDTRRRGGGILFTPSNKGIL